VSRLQLSAKVRGKDIHAGQNAQQLPTIAIVFYDDHRATVGEVDLGTWTGTFDWKKESKRVDVPPKAREGIVRIGLFGATGEVCFDAIEIKPVKR